MSASTSQSIPSQDQAMLIEPRPPEPIKIVIFPTAAKAFFQRLGTVLLLAGAIPPANAALDMGRCCQLRARQLLDELQLNPWAACSIGATITDPLTQIYDSVNATKDWAMHTCPGWQRSSLEEWLMPLVQWLAPYLALVVLCPIGESVHEKVHETENKQTGSMWLLYWARTRNLKQYFWPENAEEPCQEVSHKKVLEWINILGDPASAIWGAIYQLGMDVWVVRALVVRRDADHPDRSKKNMMLGILVVGSQTPIDHKKTNILEEIARSGDAKMLEAEIWRVLVAGTDFANGILIPVLLHFMLTAWGFYQAYKKLGDNDTAHGLAYGALYTWLIILVVLGNCFAAHTNIAAIKSSMTVLPLSGKREPLRRRYSNMVEWKHWLKEASKDDVSAQSPDGHASDKATSIEPFGWRFYLKYLLGQFAGWACVAFFGSCAIVISFTTPTVGWGCRSFNHLLFIGISLIVALLQVLRHWAEVHKVKPMITVTGWTYTLAVFVNCFVLLGGTILHFSGVYRSYGCSRIFGQRDNLLQLAPHTQIHVHNARRYWYSTGYMAYCVAWVICAVGVGCRQYFKIRLERRFAPIGSVNSTLLKP